MVTVRVQTRIDCWFIIPNPLILLRMLDNFHRPGAIWGQLELPQSIFARNLTAHRYGASLHPDRQLVRNMADLSGTAAKMSINLHI